MISFQLPKDGQPDAGLTKDYANSGLHRFKKPGSKNYQNIYPPSATLHLSNIPSGVEEEDLKKAFQNINVTVQVSDDDGAGTTSAIACGVTSSAEVSAHARTYVVVLRCVSGGMCAVVHPQPGTPIYCLLLLTAWISFIGSDYELILSLAAAFIQTAFS